MKAGKRIVNVLVLAVAAAMIAGSAEAEIISIPDAIGKTGAYSVDNFVTVIGGENSVYIVS